MKWFTLDLPADQVELALKSPVRYVAKSAYLFAGGFTYWWVLATALFPAWDSEFDARRIVFVATVGGVLGALMMWTLARRTFPPKR